MSAHNEIGTPFRRNSSLACAGVFMVFIELSFALVVNCAQVYEHLNAHTRIYMSKNALSFGQRLKTARLLLTLSQQKAADLCGVRREMWGKYERDEAEPGVHVLERFSAQGADADYLLKGVLKRSPGGEVTALAVLETIALQLEVPTGSAELESLCALLQKEKDSWFGEAMNHDDGSESRETIRAWLNKSPFVIFDQRELEDLIEKLEFALDLSGKVLSHQDKAAAIMGLLRQTKGLAQGQRLGMDKFKVAITENGKPKAHD